MIGDSRGVSSCCTYLPKVVCRVREVLEGRIEDKVVVSTISYRHNHRRDEGYLYRSFFTSLALLIIFNYVNKVSYIPSEYLHRHQLD